MPYITTNPPVTAFLLVHLGVIPKRATAPEHRFGALLEPFRTTHAPLSIEKGVRQSTCSQGFDEGRLLLCVADDDDLRVCGGVVVGTKLNSCSAEEGKPVKTTPATELAQASKIASMTILENSDRAISYTMGYASLSCKFMRQSVSLLAYLLIRRKSEHKLFPNGAQVGDFPLRCLLKRDMLVAR